MVILDYVSVLLMYSKYGENLFLLMIDRNHNLSDLVIIIIIAICGHTQFGCLCVWYN